MLNQSGESYSVQISYLYNDFCSLEGFLILSKVLVLSPPPPIFYDIIFAYREGFYKDIEIVYLLILKNLFHQIQYAIYKQR